MEILIKDGANTVLVNDVELNIVKGLTNGCTVKEIGQILKIKTRAVEGRVIRLKAKTGCKSLPELVAVFFRNKLIE